MIKIESTTLEQACKDAAAALECSASELMIEIVQSPSNGFMGLFKKSAIIVAAKKKPETKSVDEKPLKKEKQEQRPKDRTVQKAEQKKDSNKPSQNIINDTIMPESFVSMQEDEDYDMEDINYTADYEEDEEKKQESSARAVSAYEVAKKVEKEINELFGLICFKIDKIEVSAYDEDTLLVEFKGEDAALLIGKEGYRYKALSYMIFNWINTKYQLQLRLEIAEFLKNQEESVARYLSAVYENVERDG
jgi:spoIIIJ-associated protein